MSDNKELIEGLRKWKGNHGHLMPGYMRKMLEDAIAALSVAPAPVAAYTEFMIERLNIALDHIRSGVPHMASACLLADISRLKADLQESGAPPVQEGPKGR